MELHLASMENITCWAFRSLYLGATDSYTGVFSMNYLVKRHKAWREIDTYPILNQKQWIQVATSKESECEQFIKKIKDKFQEEPEKDFAYGIQLNTSCPSKNFICIGQGPALINKPKKVSNLLQTLLKQDKYKLSLKTRLGLSEQDIEKKSVVRLFEELEKINNPNFTQVVVHFKTAKQSSFTPYNYEFLKELTDFKIPLIINGGIKDYEDYLNIIKDLKQKNKETIKGFMIGREALKNPNCFIPISNNLNSTNLKLRTPEQLKEEFNQLLTQHAPKSLYLEKISRLCPWFEER
jgi:tRNA-dihydrouridine synthase